MRVHRSFAFALAGSLALLTTACGGSDGPGDIIGLTNGTGTTATGGTTATSGLTATTGDGGNITGFPLADGGTTTGDGGNTTSSSGDAGDGVDKSCGAIEQTAEVERGPVDIVIALDTSGSMTDVICNVSNQLSNFVSNVGAETRVTTVYQIGIDLAFQFNLFCMRSDPFQGTDFANDTEHFRWVNQRVDSHNAFQQLINHYGAYSDFLRDGSPTHFIVVTDDTSNMPADQFRTQMEDLLGHGFYFHAIAATGGNCSGSGVGVEYMALADATGGEQLPVCASDWTALFAQLEENVVASAPLPCEFPIPEPPSGAQFSPDKVNVSFTPRNDAKIDFFKAPSVDSCGDENAWYYDDEAAPTEIRFCPSACSLVQQTAGDLGLAFGCQSVIIL